jgi:hypothetical protein
MQVIEIHHVIKMDPALQSWLQKTFSFDSITLKLNSIMGILDDLKAKVAELTSKVAAEVTVEQSAVALIQGFGAQLAAIKQQLADAIAANDPVALQAVVDGITAAEATLDSSSADLSTAVAANTPAAPAAPAAPAQ